MTGTRAREVARRAVALVPTVVVAIATDAAAEAVSAALVLWHLHRRISAVEHRLADLEAWADELADRRTQ